MHGEAQRPLICIYNMCKAGDRAVFEVSNKSEHNNALNLKIGQKMCLRPRNRVWDMVMLVILMKETAGIALRAREKQIEELCPFGGQVRRP